MPNPTHHDYVQGLRELADFYEAHPEVSLPLYSSDFTIFAKTYNFAEKQEAKAVVIAAARAFGHAEKTYTRTDFQLKKEFSGGISLTVHSEREVVCTPVVVGKETIPGRVEPATPERYIAERVVDKIEWKCDSLLAPTQEQSFSSIVVDGELPVSSFEEGREGEEKG